MSEEPKKPQLAERVEKLIKKHRVEYHHAAGKSFDERVELLDEIFHPDSVAHKIITDHAKYTIHGHQEEGYGEGVFHKAYKSGKLSEIQHEDIVGEEKVASALETFADELLKVTEGKIYEDTIEAAKEQGATDDDIKNIKKGFLAKYINQNGNAIDILGSSYKNRFKGKTKQEFVSQLEALAETARKNYSANLINGLTQDLVNEETEKTKMGQKLYQKLQGINLEHPDILPVMLDVGTQMEHYGLAHIGAKDKLMEEGYKHKEPSEE